MWQRCRSFRRDSVLPVLSWALVVALAAGSTAGALIALPAAAEDDWYAVTLSDTVLSFGAVTTGGSHSLAATISNTLDRAVEITGADFDEGVFSTDLAGAVPFQIQADSTHTFHVYFASDQNIDYTDFLRIDLDGGVHALVARVSAQAQYPDAYYACTQNKWAEELKDSLTNLIDGHTALGYTSARDSMYGSIDNVGGWVTCVYTGRTAFFNTRAGATANGFNCEHTWPQGFSNEAEPMRSDIFHLYPTDENANNVRGSLDFGVVTTVSWSVGGSKMGTDAQGQQVFEPRDVHKGNVARSHFYYIIRYNGAYNGYVNAAKMETHLRAWHVSDAVDGAEQARNQHIYTLQHNRNPFIDHPELVDRISSFFGTAARVLEPEIAVAPEVVSMDTVGLDSTVVYHLAVLNSGDDTLHVSSVSSSNTAFEVFPASFTLAPDSYGYVTVTYQSGQVPISDSTLVTVASDDSDESSVGVTVRIEVGGCAGVGWSPEAFCLHRNYPNPFRQQTVIAFALAEGQTLDLAVYDVRGRLVQKIISGEWLAAGEHRIPVTVNDLAPGVYSCRITAGDRVLARSTIVVAR